MSKHTPGPWNIYEGGNQWGFYIGTKDLDYENGAVLVGRVQTKKGSGPKSYEEAVANSHLMAAAPDLLNICQKIAYLHAAGDDCEMGQSVSDELMAAIRKAEGREDE
jgi:hypothetical protein